MSNNKVRKPRLEQVPRFWGRKRLEAFEAEVEGQGPNVEQVQELAKLTTYERWMRILRDPSAPTLYYLWRASSNGRLDPEIKRAVDDSELEIPSSPLEGETLRIVRDCCEVGARIQAARGRVHETA